LKRSLGSANGTSKFRTECGAKGVKNVFQFSTFFVVFFKPKSKRFIKIAWKLG